MKKLERNMKNIDNHFGQNKINPTVLCDFDDTSAISSSPLLYAFVIAAEPSAWTPTIFGIRLTIPIAIRSANPL